MRVPTLFIALAGAARAATVSQTFELREWVVDYQRPTAAPRKVPFQVPTEDKMGAFLANSMYPGPVVEATVGDAIEVTVINNLLASQVDFAWEGVQVTQTAPQPIIQQGANFTYKMVAPKAGTYWWHAKLPVHAAQGLKGAIVVRDPNDPKAWSYQDEQVVFLSDAIQAPEVCLSPSGASDLGCPEIDKATVNGQWGDNSKAYPYPVISVKEGSCNRLRFVGTQSQASTFEVAVQDHMVKIVGQSTPATSFSVKSGSTTDVVLCANQKPSILSKDYSITITYQGKMTKAFSAVLRYSSSAVRAQPDISV